MERLRTLTIILSCLLVSCGVSAAGKRKIEIVNTDSLVFDQGMGNDVRRLYGNVIFKHKGVFMYCDSAYFYAKDNKFDAFNNVRVKHSDTLNLYGDTLIYLGNDQVTKVRGEVRLVDNNSVLTTRFLDYNLGTDVAYYYNGGKIVDGDNTLTSDEGFYNERTKELRFKDSVELVNPKYVMVTDTLRYNTTNNVAYFYGPTRIFNDDGFLYTENGWYNTNSDDATFYDQSYVNSGERYIYADTLFYNQIKRFGEANGNVLIKDTLQNILLYGNDASFVENPEYCIVTDSIRLIKAFEQDSLFLHCDSIVCQKLSDTVSVDTIEEYRILKAYNKVRFYKTDLQGKCDSMVYNYRDSIVEMHTSPVLWSEANQIDGRLIRLHVGENEIDRIYVDESAFIVSKDDEEQYNQVKGLNMIGYIRDGAMYQLDVIRNGETLYYMRDEQELVGVNKAECSKIVVLFENSEIKEINFYKNPNGTMYPPDQLLSSERYLMDFKWLDQLRPLGKDDIFNWRE